MNIKKDDEQDAMELKSNKKQKINRKTRVKEIKKPKRKKMKFHVCSFSWCCHGLSTILVWLCIFNWDLVTCKYTQFLF